MTELLQTLQSELQGLTVGGNTIPVNIRGHQPQNAEVPSIVIEIPQGQGRETFDRSVIEDVEITIRAHDRHGEGFYATRTQEIADEIITALRPTITVDTQPVGIFWPRRRTIYYEAEGQQAQDTLLTFTTFLNR